MNKKREFTNQEEKVLEGQPYNTEPKEIRIQRCSIRTGESGRIEGIVVTAGYNIAHHQEINLQYYPCK